MHKIAVIVIAWACCVAVPASAELASWYGDPQGTANGERFNPEAMTAASRTLPFGTIVHVCRPPHCVDVRINDRGPYVHGRDIDLSRAAARALGGLEAGVFKVAMQIVGEVAHDAVSAARPRHHHRHHVRRHHRRRST